MNRTGTISNYSVSFYPLKENGVRGLGFGLGVWEDEARRMILLIDDDDEVGFCS